jgi:hypothetical protein
MTLWITLPIVGFVFFGWIGLIVGLLIAVIASAASGARRP